MKNILHSLKHHYAVILLIAAFLILRFTTLDILPVFADEAIYIRWAQLIIDDATRYAFFPLNDGKTPLFIWLLVPFQFLFENQLVAARFVSLISGVVTMLVTYCLVQEFSKHKVTAMLAAFFVGFTPFWFFHHGMALMDGMLTFWLILATLFWVKLQKRQKSISRLDINSLFSVYKNDKASIIFFVVTGVSFGLAILTKIPAILFFPTFFLVGVAHTKTWNQRGYVGLQSGVVLLIASTIFFTLKIHPAFGQLFSRGSDFLFPVGDLFKGEVLSHTIGNLPTYSNYFWYYLTPGIILLAISGLFAKKHKYTIHAFFWSSVFFILPIAILGRVVYPRYLFPAAFGFTVAAVLAAEDFFSRYFMQAQTFKKKLIVAVLMASFLGSVVSHSIGFISGYFISSSTISFVSADREQYLTEWSSGHGIKEFAQTVKKRSEESSIAIATEGTFGTLPDGLLLYYHREDVSNIYIEGIGQPIVSIPPKFSQRAKDFDEVYLLVNSHRMQLNLPEKLLVAQYCRPFEAPCLQVWNVKTYLTDI